MLTNDAFAFDEATLNAWATAAGGEETPEF